MRDESTFIKLAPRDSPVIAIQWFVDRHKVSGGYRLSIAIDDRHGATRYSPRAPNNAALAGIISSSRRKNRSRALRRFLSRYNNVNYPWSITGSSLGPRASSVANNFFGSSTRARTQGAAALKRQPYLHSQGEDTMLIMFPASSFQSRFERAVGLTIRAPRALARAKISVYR
jgi:hypothetical protein